MSKILKPVWKAFCIATARFYAVISETAPIICPEHGDAIDALQTIRVTDIYFTTSYSAISSELSDDRAIMIAACHTDGGILIDSDTGGTYIRSKDSIRLDAENTSNFTTTFGDLSLDATNGTINLDGVTGINIGNIASTRNIIIGNTNSGTNIALRFTKGLRQTQQAQIALADSNNTLTITQLMSEIFTISPSILTTRTQTLPAANLVTVHWPDIVVNDSIKFTIINSGLGTAAVAMGSGGTMIGNTNIASNSSGRFKLRITNISGGSESYSIYRLS